MGCCCCLCVAQGFGTVRFTNTDAANRAVAQFNETVLEGRTLSVFIDKWN